MRRSTSVFWLMTAVLSLTATGANAVPSTAVSITSAQRSGSAVQIAGSLVLGDDASSAVVVGEDGSGDSAVPGMGLDFGKVTITANPGARQLTYGIEVFDMLPGVGQTGPGYGYTAPFMVDGVNAGRFLAAGNAGASFPPSAGPFWQLCTSTGSYTCPTTLSGTMNAGGITIRLGYTQGGIAPGSVVEPSGVLACPGLCSTAWAGLLFNNTGGDSAPLSSYKVPGQVTVGIAPVGTPPDSVETETTAVVAANGNWTASIGVPSTAGDYIVVARSCWGNLEALVCAEGTRTLTV